MGEQAGPVVHADSILSGSGLPDPLKLDLSEIVSLIGAGHPPPWLAEFLADFTWTLAMNRNVVARAPSRRKLKSKLDSVCRAATTLAAALQDVDLQLLLEASQLRDAASCERFRQQLRLLVEEAQKEIVAMLGPNGKVKAGAGHAFVSRSFSPEVECATLIAESWRHVSGAYPAARHDNAHKAADLLWVLSGGVRRMGAAKPSETWRHHFKLAICNSPPQPLEAFRSEVQRRLRDAAHIHATLTGGNASDNSSI